MLGFFSFKSHTFFKFDENENIKILTLVLKQILILAVLYSDEEVQLEVMSSKFSPM